jgi:hypothetical protein
LINPYVVNPVVKGVAGFVGLGATSASVLWSWHLWDSGQISDNKFGLQVGLAVVPLAGLRAGKLVGSLLSVADHQANVILGVQSAVDNLGD